MAGLMQARIVMVGLDCNVALGTVLVAGRMKESWFDAQIAVRLRSQEEGGQSWIEARCERT
ncbi:hypothetical protein E2562_036892, partial [Oryza meyeriana var. granulata]